MPGYASELNPIEPRWSYTKFSDLANFVPDEATQLKHAVTKSLKRQLTDYRLKGSFFKTTGLTLSPVQSARSSQ